MSWASELPPELLYRPLGLVALTGLDVTYNAIHKSVWDCFFSSRRPDRVPLLFKVFPGDHEYPKVRSKRTTYDCYIPKGILKTNWLFKHLNLIPAVVVVFFDLDWDEGMWRERHMECATRVEIVRNSLHSRSTKVAVVLIQKNAPLPPGEDVMAAERAAALCSACNLSSKSLFVLPHTDHLIGFTVRLENAFYELAQNYYHTEARRVKSHKDFLNKTTHQMLFVRHQFKVAFLNELKQDTTTALKHYKQAYGHVLELRIHDTNILEIKTIAGFINYKICYLSFQHNAPDAIAQFRKHIDFFKNKIGPADLAFEHSAWMAKQFHVFGDLFDSTIKLGLTAIQTQHPGFYYQQAANHAITRKQLCRTICKVLSKQLTSDPIEQLEKLDYYGQRPWRQGHQSIEPLDVPKEKEGMLALQNKELAVNHSGLIIPLLSSAVSQFKKYKSPRMKRYLMVQMGEEYHHGKEYVKALAMLSKVTVDYRCECWWSLLTSILETSLKSAYLIAKIQEYITICLELIGKYSDIVPEDKMRIQMNLIRVMSKANPEPEPGLDHASIEDAKKLWSERGGQEDNMFDIDMQNIVAFVECKATFCSMSFSADNQVCIDVYLRSHCQFPIRFSKLCVMLSNQFYNQSCVVADRQGISAAAVESEAVSSSSADLYLVPGQVKHYKFSFMPTGDDVGSQLQINSVILELGSMSERCAILHWQGAGGDTITAQTITKQKPVLKQKKTTMDTSSVIEWDQIKLYSNASITHRPANVVVQMQHNPPSLLNEVYPITMSVTNREEANITEVIISLGIQQHQDEETEETTHVSVDVAEFDGQDIPQRSGLTMENLLPGQQCKRQFFMKSTQTGVRVVTAKVQYDIEVDIPGQQTITCTCFKEETFSLHIVTPFEVSIKLANTKLEAVESAYTDEPVIVMTEIRSTSPWPVILTGSQFALNEVVKTCGEYPSQIQQVCLKKSECAAECVCLTAPWTLPLGSYNVHWKRKSDAENTEGIPSVTTSFRLPMLSVEHIPVYISCDLPAYGTVKSLLPIVYTIENRTCYIQEIDVNMEHTDSFMFAGNKQLRFRLLPSSNHKLTYNLYPLIPGHVMLPKLHLDMVRYPDTMEEPVRKMLPSHIFIKPSCKTGEPSMDS